MRLKRNFFCPKWLLRQLYFCASALILLGCLSNCSRVGPGYADYIEALQLIHDNAPTQDVLRRLNAAIEQEPENAVYIARRAHLYFDVGDFLSAHRDYARLLRLTPRDAQLNYMMGLTQGRLDRLPDALASCQMAVNLAPCSDSFHNGLAVCYLAMGKLNDAKREIELAIKYAPQYQRWHYTKALILSRLGRKAEAIDEFNKTVVLTRMLPDNSRQEVHFNGELEFKRAVSMKRNELDRLWDYGGRWLSPNMDKDYGTKSP